MPESGASWCPNPPSIHETEEMSFNIAAGSNLKECRKLVIPTPCA